VHPVVELVGGEQATFVEPFPDGGKIGGGVTESRITRFEARVSPPQEPLAFL
jgi:hypothetical protein